ncbi:MAG: hypothetical protein J7604_26425 [Sporocytophaga sp.]|uniref:hypothetical protein n=1 Tax=Sporocytophaga sp. TaxID=2231183 RepID=UPI001B173E54|nr:hypothetical protein [Sporocytophaga sp.]MBO9703770.1 hypothetical protein [Sporocytophaga sp.]
MSLPLSLSDAHSGSIKKNIRIKFIFSWVVLFLTFIFCWEMLIFYTLKPCTMMLGVISFVMVYHFKGSGSIIFIAFLSCLLAIVSYLVAMYTYCSVVLPSNLFKTTDFYFSFVQEHFSSIEYSLLMAGTYLAYALKK